MDEGAMMHTRRNYVKYSGTDDLAQGFLTFLCDHVPLQHFDR